MISLEILAKFGNFQTKNSWNRFHKSRGLKIFHETEINLFHSVWYFGKFALTPKNFRQTVFNRTIKTNIPWNQINSFLFAYYFNAKFRHFDKKNPGYYEEYCAFPSNWRNLASTVWKSRQTHDLSPFLKENCHFFVNSTFC